MNTVTVDPSALTAEAEAVTAQAAVSEPQIPGELTAEPVAPQVTAADYEPVAYLLYDQLADVIAPNWNITHEEKLQISKATAHAFVLWFPDQTIPPKYLALLGIAGAMWAIASARRDPKTKQFLPRKIEAPPSDATKTGTAAAH